ncbi:MAG: protein phosphatase 2C domain-containing protein [Caulobacteraceae bacterium]
MSQVTESRSGPFFEAHASHPGAVRSENEDAFLARGGEGFWLVADGMGGLDDGQWASRTLAMELAEAPFSGDLERDAATVAEVIRHANFVIFKESTERKNHMGSTAVALLVRGARFAVVWAGDSRLYLWRDGALSQVTVDHTQVQQMVDAGYLTKREAHDHPMSHVLARAVGTQAELETETLVGDVRAGDLFLLCSDGLPRVLEDEEIGREVEAGNPVAMVERMLAIALERGSPDNVTIMTIGCVDPAGAMAGAMAARAPIFGGAASEEGTVVFEAPPVAPAEPAAAPASARKRGAPAVVGAIVAALAIAALGIGGWLLLPRLNHAAATLTQVVAAPGAVPQTGLRQFEAALGGVGCSWLQIEKIAPGPTGMDIAVSGVAASPAPVQSALQAAATAAKVPVADIDLSSIAPSPPGLCATLDALRPYRAATTQTGQNLTAAQDSFAVMKQADGKQAGRAIVTATPPPQGDFAVLELGADDSLSVVAADRQTFQTLAGAGTVVSKVPDAGGYRLQADYAKPGWSSLILLTGQGPFPRALLTQPPGPRTAAWSGQFAAAARAGGWHAEMAWYDIMTGSDLSVIPQTQATSANAAVVSNALAAGRLLQQQQQARRATATNAATAPAANGAMAAASNVTVTTTPTAKGAPARGRNAAPTNAAKSDAPL